MKQLFLKPAEEPPIKIERKVPVVSNGSRTISLAFKPTVTVSRGGPSWPHQGIHPPSWWHEIKDPAKLTPYEQRVVTIFAKLAEKRRGFLASAEAPKVPPLNESDLLDNTIVEGKTISEWLKIDQAGEEVARAKRNGTSWYVYESQLPGWASWALSKWRERGAPTRFDAIKVQYESLIDKAREQEKFAAMDEKEALESFEAIKPSKKSKYKASDELIEKDRNKAEKRSEAARKKMARAEELRAEAEALIENYKKGATT